MPTTAFDDKSEHCIPFILECLDAHRTRYAEQRDGPSPNQPPPPPLFLGVNGIQGSGKTTLVATLQETLTSPSYDLTTVVFSIDDLYLPHDEQVALARSHPTNPLVQHRGVPGTHDIRAGAQLLQALARQETDVSLPSYDKSAFSGAGDRRPRSEWTIVNPGGRRPVDVVIMEGWCVGFRALPDEELRSRWRSAHEKATSAAGSDEYEGQLGRVKLEDVAFINDSLRAYDDLTDKLAALIYIDAEDTRFVYAWRQEQEAALRAAKGTGMTDEQVVGFVNGYYPCYELYSSALRGGIFSTAGKTGRQLHLVVGRDRRLRDVRRVHGS